MSTSSEEEGVLVPHRIAVTVLASTVALVIILAGILSFVKIDTLIARRKSTQYHNTHK